MERNVMIMMVLASRDEWIIKVGAVYDEHVRR